MIARPQFADLPALALSMSIFAAATFLSPAPWTQATFAAEIEMPTIFGDAMVLQRDKPVHVWGWSDPDVMVRVSMDQSVHGESTTDQDGRFDIELPAMDHDGAKPHALTITSGSDSVEIKNILIGEVYLCSGQSNMAWPVDNSVDADLEKLSANFPNIRIISVPNRASQKPERSFDGQWETVTPKTIGDFSAVGYYFGRQIHQTIGVPIGLIDNAWGGSAAEAWVPSETLKQNPMYADAIAKWELKAKTYDIEAVKRAWQAKVAKWKSNGEKGSKPTMPKNSLEGQHRIGNLYYGCLTPIIGFPIRGVIWYQGESNSSRAFEYRDLFPRMIQKWRQDWGDEFGFYWVQLADYKAEVDSPGDSDWAELREAQTMALKVPRTGQAVIIDLGESIDIHPKDKQNVAKRLARWTLAKDFEFEISHQSPTYQTSTIEGKKMLIDFDHVGLGLETFDVAKVRGFTIAGDDKIFVDAVAKIIDNDTVEVSSPTVANPVAVRYGWADNPVVNLQSSDGLPATPFRTDTTQGVTQ